MKPIIQSCLSILAATRCTMTYATCTGDPTWSRTSPSMSQSATLVGELRQTTCIARDICSPCPFLFGNRKIFPWILLWVYPAQPRAITLSGSLWTISLSLLILSWWRFHIEPGSMRRYTLIRLWPYMEFPLLSSLIGDQSLSPTSRSNSRNVLVFVSSEAQLIIRKWMGKQKG